MAKARLNVSLDTDLVDFIKLYVQQHRTTVSDVVTQFILSLRRHSEGEAMELIFANPEFFQALCDVQARLKTGEAQWHTCEEVFGTP